MNFFTQLVSGTCMIESESELPLWPAAYCQSVRLGVKPLEADHQCLFFFHGNSCSHIPCVTSSVTRGCVCFLWICLLGLCEVSLSTLHTCRTIFKNKLQTLMRVILIQLAIFSLLSNFEKMEVCLWDRHDVCVSVYPLYQLLNAWTNQ
jgi:hypothetical protein